jgi:polyisoprenoid-binding protein YceI
MALSGAVPSHAQAQRFAIDGGQSEVEFRVRYLGLFTLGGRFGHVSGIVTVDPAHWETLEVAIEIPLDSLETRPEFWRSDMLGPRFFDAARYPTMSFRATGAERLGAETGAAAGTLTLHGATGPVRLQVRISTTTGALHVDGETRISRSAFGLGTSMPFASDEVRVTLRIRTLPAGTP